jgi:hypothetical protein
MNERIELLASQCYSTGPMGKDGWPEYTKFNEVKFAELIVRECAEIADKAEPYKANDLIKQHFGVEE